MHCLDRPSSDLQSRLLAGSAHNEDAAVVQIPQGKAIVQTVDILTPVVNDPFSFGRIAACNALSDVYAMGGDPWCAMNIACFPNELAETSPDVLKQILLGGKSALDEAGAVLCGGHTIDDETIKYGLSVTGIIDPTHIAANDRLKEGLLLLLTKPLGIGILATGVKARWEYADESEARIVEVSGHLNRGGARVIQECGLAAATDITGFGLIGHALELAKASDLCLAINVESLPILPHVLDYASDGLIPAGAYRNRSFCSKDVLIEGSVPQDPLMVAYDPQTSGGLLLAIPREKLAHAKDILESCGDLACVIGEVLPKRNDGIKILLR